MAQPYIRPSLRLDPQNFENLSLAELAILEMTNPSVKRGNKTAYVLTTKDAYLWGVAISMLVERNPWFTPEILVNEWSRSITRYQRTVSKSKPLWKSSIPSHEIWKQRNLVLDTIWKVDKRLPKMGLYRKTYKSIQSCVEKGLIDDPLHVAVAGKVIAVLGFVPVSFTRKTQHGKVIHRKVSAAYWRYEAKANKDGTESREVHFKLLTALKAFLKVLV